jgi:hypothetical protein
MCHLILINEPVSYLYKQLKILESLIKSEKETNYTKLGINQWYSEKWK